MDIGQKVEVRTHYNGSWSSGFKVVEVVSKGYIVRRGSDGGLLPAVMPAADVRAAAPDRAMTPTRP